MHKEFKILKNKQKNPKGNMYPNSNIYRKSHFFSRQRFPASTQLRGLTIDSLLVNKPVDSVKDLVTFLNSLFLVSIDLISDDEAHLIQECYKQANHLRNTRYQLHSTLISFLWERRDIQRYKTEHTSSFSARLPRASLHPKENCFLCLSEFGHIVLCFVYLFSGQLPWCSQTHSDRSLLRI